MCLLDVSVGRIITNLEYGLSPVRCRSTICSKLTDHYKIVYKRKFCHLGSIFIHENVLGILARGIAKIHHHVPRTEKHDLFQIRLRITET